MRIHPAEETTMANRSQRAPSKRSPAARAVVSDPASTNIASQDSTAQDAAAFSFAQAQLQAAITLADLVFKGAEDIRRAQLEAAHHAHERHEKALAEVSSASNPNQLFKLQAELLRDDMETAGLYWQQITTAVAHLQTEALSLMARNQAAAGGGFARLAARPLGGLPAQAAVAQVEPADADATHAWNQWTDLGKQWTEMLYRTEASLH
jgi:phasin family protein